MNVHQTRHSPVFREFTFYAAILWLYCLVLVCLHAASLLLRMWEGNVSAHVQTAQAVYV